MPSPPPYLESVDLEVGFAKRGHEIAEAFSADDMAKNFLRAYNGIVFATGEVLSFEFHGQILRVAVKGVQIVDLPGRQSEATHYGVVMEKTDITFMKSPDSAIKLKSSAKKCVYSLAQQYKSVWLNGAGRL